MIFEMITNNPEMAKYCRKEVLQSFFIVKTDFLTFYRFSQTKISW